MQTTHLTQADFNQFLQERCKERVEELQKEIRALEYVKRDRGHWNWERARYSSLGSMLKINEDILSLLDPEYTPMQ